MELSDKEWQILEPLMPALPTGQKGRPWRENREVLDGMLWVLRTGHLGVIYRRSIHRIKRVIVASNNGLWMAHLKRWSQRSQKNLRNAVT